MKKFTILLLVMLFSVAWAGKVYKKVNPDGTVEFSDTPVEGAKEIEVRTPQVVPAHKPSLPATSPGNTQPAQGGSYQIQILRPKDDDVVIANDGNLDIVLSVTPVLRLDDGDQIKVMLGNRIKLSGSKAVQLNDVPRGTHTIEAMVIDRFGVTLSQSVSIKVHVKRVVQKAPASGAPTSPTNPPKPAKPAVSPTNPPRP